MAILRRFALGFASILRERRGLNGRDDRRRGMAG
jgi:hypothetical protein